MKILIDSQIFGLQDYGGISRYYAEIIKRIDSSDIQVSTPPLVHNNHYLGKKKNWLKDNFLYKFKYRNYIYFLINTILQIPVIIKKNFDIIHPTYYEINYPKILCNKKMVITVYDLIHEKMNKNYKKLSKSIQTKKEKYLKRADRIIAISENTKKDIIEIYNIPKEKIDVVYLGNSLMNWDKRNRLKLPHKYILFVGQRWLYKNFNKFIVAASKVLKKNERLSVVCAGGGKFTSKEISIIKKLGIDGRVFQISFSTDRDLSEIYARSLIFVYPSLYEGFGIPILEAFASKAAIALSDTSCFPEIAGNAAEYFDPNKVDSISKAIEKIISNESYRKNLIRRGEKKLNDYSWNITATKTVDVYRKVLNDI